MSERRATSEPHAGHQPANGGGVVKAERKLLELCKRILPDVVAHVHFQPARAAHKQEHAQALDDDQSGIYKAVQPKPLSGAALDEMVDGIAGELRIGKVDPAPPAARA